MKYILLILFILLIPVAFSAKQDFSTTINMKVYYNGSVSIINITTEQDTHIYDGLANSSNSFSLTITRNVSTSSDIENHLSNLTGTMSSLTQTCDTIAKQYGDVNRYFSLYNQCNVDIASCNKEKENNKIKIDELTPLKLNFEKCAKDLSETQVNLNKYSNEIIPSYQSNITSMATRTDTAEKSKWLYFFFGVIGASVIAVIIERRKTGSIQREKVVGLNR